MGGAAFYSFKAAPGQLFQASLASQKFVPVLRLYDAHGSLVGSSGDDADGLEGRITHMVVDGGDCTACRSPRSATAAAATSAWR